MILIRLMPDGLRLGLHPADCTEDDHCTVQNANRALYLRGKIHMSWRIDDIDLSALPETGGGCRSYGNSPFLFLYHPVHYRLTVIDFAYPVALARVIENSFSGCCLARINMGYDTDIADFFQIGYKLLHLSFIHSGHQL
ncbi:hypothetical protein ES703_56082 [subsurface metagenome]